MQYNRFNARRHGKLISEDRTAVAPAYEFAVLVDAATPVRPHQPVLRTNHPTDAVAFAYIAAGTMVHNAANFRPDNPRKFFDSTFRTIRQSFCQRAGLKSFHVDCLERALLPSAAFALSQFDPDSARLSVATLGDARALIVLPGLEDTVLITSNTLTDHFRAAEACRTDLKRERRFAEARANREEIAAGMNNPNHPHPYAILSVHPEAAQAVQMRQFDIPAGETAQVLLMSDGFFNMLESGFVSPAELLAAADSRSRTAALVKNYRAYLRTNDLPGDDDLSCVRCDYTAPAPAAVAA